MGFAADVKKWAGRALNLTDVKLTRVALAAYKGALLRSPILTERFRDSWRLSRNTPDFGVEPPRDPKADISPNAGAGGTIPATPAEVSKALAACGRIRFGDTVYISNSLPYAERLEGGYSQQAPAGVLALALQDAEIEAASSQFSPIGASDADEAMEEGADYGIGAAFSR